MKAKNPKADLEKSKSLFLEIGLVIALALAVTAFEWPSKGEISVPKWETGEMPEDIELPQNIVDKEPPKKIEIPSIPDVLTIVPDGDMDVTGNVDVFIDLGNDQLKNIYLFRSSTDDPEDINEIYQVYNIQEQPTFMGKDYNEFGRYIAKNMIYPLLAIDNGIQGMVVVEFVVDIDGSVTNLRVLRSVDPLLDREAIRIISSSPRWEPGKHNGKPQRVSFSFPIIFKLKI